jgi:hypothetical protein
VAGFIQIELPNALTYWKLVHLSLTISTLAGCRPTKCALDRWDSSPFSSIILALGFSCFPTLSTPTHLPVTQTVNRLDWLHDESHIRQYRSSEWERMLIDAGFQIEAIEPYTQHRPLSSLTDNVDPKNVQEIEKIIAGLNESQRQAMNVIEQDGQIYLNHSYVMIAAVKAER